MSELSNNYKENGSVVFLVFLLMPVNWLVETVKWRYLVNGVQRLSFLKAIQSIFFGIFLSLITPNRIGELGGRLVYIKAENRLNVFYANLLCSVSQLMITLIAGLFAMNSLHPFFLSKDEFDGSWLLGITVLLILIMLYVYYTSNRLLSLLSFFSDKLNIKGHRLKIKLSGKNRTKLLGMSLLRFAVFCFQFFLLLQIVEPEIVLMDAFLAIMLIFFIAAVIPTAWISDLPVRTSIAFMVLEGMGYSGLSGLISSIVLWMINLMVPAMLGLFVIPKVNWLSLKNNRL